MSRPRSTLIIASGAVFGCALLVFMDGAVTASKAKLPYNFLMWLPTLIALLGTFALLLVNPVHILGIDNDMDDDDSIKKTKSIFFLGALLLFTSICLSIWKTVDPYGNKGLVWPGVALLVHSLLLMLMNCSLFIARVRYDD
ncbi:hypothetical protein, conserved [Leishmania tarentolae]|uniref:Transmembrane protein n=1 Tax=Leishmania tarentolae TaxID=5689 RepID=A0A640KM70_LEITA|nr:hypothetical protein, conserved [Leishmania tarentolae]